MALKIPVPVTFLPTHLIVIDEGTYLTALFSRLDAAKISHPRLRYIESSAIIRQVLMAFTLNGRHVWSVGGVYHVTELGKGKYKSGAWVNQLATKVENRWAVWDQVLPVSAKDLRRTARLLAPYYGQDSFRVDGLGVALGCVWSALTVSPRHGELSFLALSMALEAICNPGKQEITHQLAERIAVLTRKGVVARNERYTEVKRLYDLRSQIAHARPIIKKGLITGNMLLISAKGSNMPAADLHKMLDVVLDVIRCVLYSPDLMKILQDSKNENAVAKAFDEYFKVRLFS